MLFKGPSGFALISNLMLNACMATVLSLILLFYTQMTTGAPVFTVESWSNSFVISFLAGFFFSYILPVTNWGMGLAHMLKLEGIGGYLVQTTVIGCVMATCITFVNSFLNMFASQGFGAVLESFSMLTPVAILVAVVLIPFILKPILGLSGKLSEFAPAIA